MDQVTDQVGLTKEFIAKKLFELTQAKIPKEQKLKGWFDKRTKSVAVLRSSRARPMIFCLNE